jgi:hypothetical protein
MASSLFKLYELVSAFFETINKHQPMKKISAIIAAVILPLHVYANGVEASALKDQTFTYYTSSQMQKMASAFVEVHGKTKPNPKLIAKAAEFRGYLLSKAESWNKDWRGKCEGPAGMTPENPDDLVLQIATIVAKLSAKELADVGESRPNMLLGFGVLGRCMLSR